MSNIVKTDRLRHFFTRRGHAFSAPPAPHPFVQPERDDPPDSKTPPAIKFAKAGLWEECFAEIEGDPSSCNARDGSGQTALHVAGSSGNIAATGQLLSLGFEPSPDNWGWTPLHCASNGRYIESPEDGERFLRVISFLIENGSDMTAKREDKSTFLHHLASWSFFPVPPTFFEVFRAGLDVIDVNSATEIGETILHKAASSNNSALVELLLDQGADPTLSDCSNYTPLHYAASSGALPLIKLLLDSGSPLLAVDKFQRTACDLAFLASHFECSCFLGDLMQKQGNSGQPTPLTASRDRSYSPFDHIDVMVSMMGRKGQNYSSTSLLANAKLSSRSASHLRSSFRENKAKKLAKSPESGFPVPRRPIDHDRVAHDSLPGPSPLFRAVNAQTGEGPPNDPPPPRPCPLSDTIDTILTGSNEDPFAGSHDSPKIDGGELREEAEVEEEDVSDVWYDEIGSDYVDRGGESTEATTVAETQGDEIVGDGAAGEKEVKPIVLLPGSKNNGSWIIEVGSQSLGVLRADLEFCLERTGYDEFYFTRNFVANDLTGSQVVNEMEDEEMWKALKRSDFNRQATFIGTRKSRAVIISVRLGGERESMTQLSNQYRALMRTSKQDIRFWLTGIPSPNSRQRFTGKNTRVFLEELSNRFPKIRNLKEVRGTQILRSLVAMECFCSIQAYTVPIILATEKSSKKGILHNSIKSLSPENLDQFGSFLASLGSRIDLRNWHGYHGNVDISPPFHQGHHAIFSMLHHRPVIMPVVPWFHGPPEEFVRGCTTALVYVEKGSVRLPLPNGGYVHSYIVVRPEGENNYSVQDVFACSIGRCKPTIPQSYFFSGGPQLAEFLLFKMINSDRAASFCRDEECLDVLRRRNRQAILDAVVEGSKLLLDQPQGGGSGGDSPNLPHHAKLASQTFL